MTLSILILNYKTKGLLRQCLQALRASHFSYPTEVIVIDNNSGDGSVDMVREQFPEVQLIASSRNVGFGAGNNLGLALAKGTYCFIMNTDVAVSAEAVDQLISYLESHAQVGIAVPKLINPDGSTQQSTYEFPSLWIPVLRRTPLGKFPPAKKLLRRFLMSGWDHNSSRSVGWALGGCLCIRRSALAEVGTFDDRFFLYFEDTDLCRRFWEKGWEVHYVHTAEMVHYHRRESAENPGLGGVLSYPTRVHIRSALQYFRKYYRQPKPPHSL